MAKSATVSKYTKVDYFHFSEGNEKLSILVES